MNSSAGNKKHPLYATWHSMKSRCLNPNNKRFHCYGARGITVCEAWLTFSNYAADIYREIGPRPSLSHTLDRKDNHVGYQPGNMRWATSKEQGRNRQLRRMVTMNNETRCVAEWSEIFGTKPYVIRGRLNSGWSASDAFTAPKHARRGPGVLAKQTTT